MLKYRWYVLVIFTVVLLWTLKGASTLGLNPNNRVFFGEEDSQFSSLLRFEADFGSNTSLLFGISSDADVSRDPVLVDAVRWLTDRSWRIDGVTRVDSIATYPFGVYSEESIRLSNLADVFCPEVCSDLGPEGLLKEHLVSRLISADGQTLSVIASVELDVEDSVAVSRISGEVKDLREEFSDEFPNLRLFVTGAVPMMQAFMDASNADLGGLLLMAVALFVLLLWVFLRSLALTSILVLIGVASIVITMGVAGWLGHTVNTATATTPLVIFTLVVAGSMHVFLYLAREPAETSEMVLASIQRAYAANLRPVLLAAATSIVGLLSLVFVSAPPIKELGILSAFGVFVGTTLLLTVAPCLLAMMNRVRPSKMVVVVQRLLNNQARRIEARSERPAWFAALFAMLVCLLPLMAIDEDFVRYFGETNKFRHDSEQMTERLAGPYHVEVLVDTGAAGGIYNPEVIRVVDALAEHFRSDLRVANVLSVADILREVALALDNRESLEGLDADSLAQFFLSFELALEKGQSTTDFVDVDHRYVRVSVLFGDVSMTDIREFESQAYDWAATELPRNLSLIVTGEGVPTAHLSGNSIRQLMTGIALSLAFSSLLIGWIYQNMRIVLVMLLGISVPVLSGFGIWAALVGEIGMAATLVIAVTIGVVIDDAIHLLYRFHDGIRELGLSADEAAGYSVHRTATAIVTTSVVLSGGFSLLMLSEFEMNSAFGICSALVIVMALVYNTALMPRSLVWAMGRNTK